MLDIYAQDLLTVLDEALQPPAHLTVFQLAEWHSHTLRSRLPLIREALRLAREENDSGLATLLVDQAFAEHPNPPCAARAVGGGGARVSHHLRSPQSEGELPIPEHVLGPLLYKQWNLTIEGQPPDEQYVARRPIGWSGEGDPFERITAPTRRELLRALGHRLLGISSPPAS
jgi:hypothetical protein